jgi:hypothetical protein
MAVFLNMLGASSAKPQTPQVNPNTPVIQTAKLDQEMKGDFASRFTWKSVQFGRCHVLSIMQDNAHVRLLG